MAVKESPELSTRPEEVRCLFFTSIKRAFLKVRLPKTFPDFWKGELQDSTTLRDEWRRRAPYAFTLGNCSRAVCVSFANVKKKLQSTRMGLLTNDAFLLLCKRTRRSECDFKTRNKPRTTNTENCLSVNDH